MLRLFVARRHVTLRRGRSRGRRGGRRGFGVLRAVTANDVEKTVERVAHRPRLLARIGEPRGAPSPLGERLGGALTARTELALEVRRCAFVDVIAPREVAIIVERGTDVDGIGERLRHQIDVTAAAT